MRGGMSFFHEARALMKEIQMQCLGNGLHSHSPQPAREPELVVKQGLVRSVSLW